MGSGRGLLPHILHFSGNTGRGAFKSPHGNLLEKQDSLVGHTGFWGVLGRVRRCRETGLQEAPTSSALAQAGSGPTDLFNARQGSHCQPQIPVSSQHMLEHGLLSEQGKGWKLPNPPLGLQGEPHSKSRLTDEKQLLVCLQE